jgi:hypothetical protein
VVTLIIETMRICIKCGDFYADGLLAFCPADGTPLISVDAGSEIWSEGVRVIEGKENALRKQKRKLRWRRVAMSVMTMLITTLVVVVVVINSLIYLKPKREEVALTPPSTQPLRPAIAPVASITPKTPDQPVPTPSPQPTATPTHTASPIATETITPPRDTEAPPTPTETATPAATPTQIATATPTATPSSTPSPSPSPRTPAPGPTPSPKQSPTPALTPDLRPPPPPPPPAPVCTDADQSREREIVIRSFGWMWRRRIEGERRRVIAENMPDGVEHAEAQLGAIEYTAVFLKACTAGVVIARYVWQIRANVNERVRVMNVPREKRFACGKIRGVWLCG